MRLVTAGRNRPRLVANGLGLAREEAAMSLLLVTHPECDGHDVVGHPESPARMRAVLGGIAASEFRDAVVHVAAPLAGIESLLAVHDERLIEAIRNTSVSGGARFDADTVAVAGSWGAAQRAAGAGLAAIEALRNGDADAAMCVVRPPGHHATPQRPMGFCLFNNIAVAARALADAGESVVIVDWDAHHGNGTQAMCEGDSRIGFVSIHEWPQYPGTGRPDDHGRLGNIINVAVPAGTTGAVYRTLFVDVVAPFVAARRATWLLLSAGFDAHRADPLTNLGLTGADFADLARDASQLVTRGRVVAFLEGGYDLAALGESAAACVGGLLGRRVDGVRSDANDDADPAAARVVAAAARYVAERAWAR